jgi:hypothetical protein
MVLFLHLKSFAPLSTQCQCKNTFISLPANNLTDSMCSANCVVHVLSLLFLIYLLRTFCKFFSLCAESQDTFPTHILPIMIKLKYYE